MATRVSQQLARRIALHHQLLDPQSDLPDGKEGVAQAIEALGYVQIDTIAVVERAHHHTLWTRRPDYDAEMLHELQAVDRRIFEYWGHAASYLPISDYRYYLPRMERHREPESSKWMKRRLERAGHLLEPVKERIRQEGPLQARDFKAPERKGSTWWDWKPAKIALEILYWRGELMIAERRNFQKVYDLTERVLPEDVDTTVPDEDQLGRFLVRRALAAHGVAQEREIQEHIHAAGKEVISQALAELVEDGQALAIEVEGIEGNLYYTAPDTLERAAQRERLPPRVLLLSPFDNAIIQRDRLERLFGFAYALECYKPAAKRQYGYFVLPLLWGERFVGRLDPKADRKEKVLRIRNLVFEEGFSAFEALLPPLVEALDDFARFNKCREVVLEKVSPTQIQSPLERALRSRNGA